MACDHKLQYGLVVLAAALLAMVLSWWVWDDAAAFIHYAVDAKSNPGLFLLMFALLPLVGFPISALLILSGIKFGAWTGVLVMLAGMPLHLLVSFLVANSFLRSLLQQFLVKMDYQLPQIPRDHILWFSFVFMAVPGLPYTVKNYALPLAGAPFRQYFLCGYLVQAAMGVPFVVAGNAVAGKHLAMLALVFVLMAAIYAGVLWLRKRKGAILAVNPSPPADPPADAGTAAGDDRKHSPN